jgi:shikimate 5-dehydrogenase
MKKAFIIGDNVSKGARSPVLWNYVYKKLDIKSIMTPLDISSANDLSEFITQMKISDEFIASAVAAPLKIFSRSIIEEINSTQEYIDPCNCFFKTSAGLKCINTDILAAVESIEQYLPLKDIKSLTLCGDGAISMGLANHFASLEINKNILARSRKNDSLFKSFGFNFYSFSEINEVPADTDLLINCTSIGRDGFSSVSPISKTALKKFGHALVFDVNYINSPSKLLRDAKELGMQVMDGSRMNLMQAAIAFHQSNYEVELSQEEIFDLMLRSIDTS